MMKKHIYNKVYGAALLATLLTAATACTNEMPLADNGQEPDPKPELHTLTTVTVSQDAGAQTRLQYMESGGTMDVKWEVDDVIYIGTQPALNRGQTKSLEDAGFKPYRCTRVNGTQATFTADGTGLSVTEGTKVFAFHAKKENTIIGNWNGYIFCISFLKAGSNTSVSVTSPITFIPQRQTANENTDHISDYDFMAASATYSEGGTHFTFERGVSLIKFTLTLPDEASGKSMKELVFSATGNNSNLSSNFNLSYTVFGGEGNAEKQNTLLLGPGTEGFPCDNNLGGKPQLTAYLVYNSSTYGSTEANVTVTDTEGTQYSADFTCKLINRNCFYNAELTLAKKEAVVP